MMTEEQEQLPALICCGTCRFYNVVCVRFPQVVRKSPEEVCGEHKFPEPPGELLELRIDDWDDLDTRSRRKLKAMHLKTLGDVLTFGRQSVVFAGAVDLPTLKNLDEAFLKIGVEW